MSQAADNFDAWIRSSFAQMNTELEELYFACDDPASVTGIGDSKKTALMNEGRALILPLAAEGNTEQQFDAAFDVLGNLGFFLAALRRHELTNPDKETESPFKDCSALGLHIASSIGVVPRFATAHLSTHNRAVNGKQKSFTTLRDERIFNEYNTFGILAFKRAGSALMRIPPMGVSAPAAALLLQEAKAALEEVRASNKTLFTELDVDRFFYCVRPYYKPYRVGKNVYRGANAGDFAEINQIDLLLGLCRAGDPQYAQIMEDKILFMMPKDQQSLRDSLGMRPLLDEFLDLLPHCKSEPWFKTNCQLYLDVCDAFGQTATQHHNMLVKKFIAKPSDEVESKYLKQITASGPPLPALMEALQNLRDLRLAAPRDDMETAFTKLQRLRDSLKQ